MVDNFTKKRRQEERELAKQKSEAEKEREVEQLSEKLLEIQRKLAEIIARRNLYKEFMNEKLAKRIKDILKKLKDQRFTVHKNLDWFFRHIESTIADFEKLQDEGTALELKKLIGIYHDEEFEKEYLREEKRKLEQAQKSHLIKNIDELMEEVLVRINELKEKDRKTAAWHRWYVKKLKNIKERLKISEREFLREQAGHIVGIPDFKTLTDETKGFLHRLIHVYDDKELARKLGKEGSVHKLLSYHMVIKFVRFILEEVVVGGKEINWDKFREFKKNLPMYIKKVRKENEDLAKFLEEESKKEKEKYDPKEWAEKLTLELKKLEEGEYKEKVVGEFKQEFEKDVSDRVKELVEEEVSASRELITVIDKRLKQLDKIRKNRFKKADKVLEKRYDHWTKEYKRISKEIFPKMSDKQFDSMNVFMKEFSDLTREEGRKLAVLRELSPQFNKANSAALGTFDLAKKDVATQQGEDKIIPPKVVERIEKELERVKAIVEWKNKTGERAGIVPDLRKDKRRFSKLINLGQKAIDLEIKVIEEEAEVCRKKEIPLTELKSHIQTEMKKVVE